jgi:hypothetical protein
MWCCYGSINNNNNNNNKHISADRVIEYWRPLTNIYVKARESWRQQQKKWADYLETPR